ncbi:thioredoxin reductase (NADPH) [Gracilibacillus ureilyticus]|uniref:Ferredoxin--NADP reductase n=1 Tax=Gracilibacillus ureilyticus TaxID=531814 RepID=A0A1H9Q5X1_9BACI|nr:NAD(P)/FAD-dependent oxidoreductase [Gracilibacillus ureilyticus]SER55966.1 thioredoxin reductase (NADPH) [Gracilibacillus ureilyticus]
MRQEDCFDVTVIGGGPAGLYSAFYSGLREMKTKIIEFQPQLGGKIHVYPEKMIWDVGGLLPVTGQQLIDQLTEQGLTFQPEVVLNEKVESIEKRADGIFLLHGSTGKVHYTRTVIVATGSGILKPQKLEIDGAERFELTNLHYTVQSFKKFKDKVVIISGGRDSAIDIANELEPIAKKVYLTYRRENLNGHEAQITQLLNSSIECFFQTTITKLISNQKKEKINQVELTNSKTGEVTSIPVDDVVINHGFDRDSSLIENSDLPIELIDDFYIAGDNKSASNVGGLFAAGDKLKNDGKVHLILGAFQDAANAVNSAKKYLEPEATEYAMVSSHNDIFKEKNKKLVQDLLK